MRIREKQSDQNTNGMPSLIDKSCIIKGNITQASNVRIEGTVDGNISEVGNLVIGESGIVNGNIEVKTIVVFGAVQGDVTSEESVEIKESGKVSGKITTKILTIERGAQYSGKITMGNEELLKNE